MPGSNVPYYLKYVQICFGHSPIMIPNNFRITLKFVEYL